MPILNLAQFNDAITNKLPASILAGLKDEIENSIGIVVDQMKANCPVSSPGDRWGGPTHSEHLRDSIRAKWGTPRDRTPLGLRMTLIYGSDGTLVQGHGRQFQLARLMEFGTLKMHAQPFFFPIWRAYKRKLRLNMTRRVNAVITAANAGAYSTADTSMPDEDIAA